MPDDCHYRKDKFIKLLPDAQAPTPGTYRWIKWEELQRLSEQNGLAGVRCADWDRASIDRGGKGVAGYARKGCLDGYFKLTNQP